MSDSLQQNYFELFQLPLQFEVDAQQLSKRYLQLQQQYHPDSHATASDVQKLQAVQWTAHINDAFQTLKQPLPRAYYLLGVLGYAVDDKDTAMDADFLLRQMELREQLESVTESEDPLAALQEIRSQLRQDERELNQRLGQQFTEGSELSLRQAQEGVKRMKFLLRLKEELQGTEETLL